MLAATLAISTYTMVQVRKQRLVITAQLNELQDVASKLVRSEGVEEGKVSMEKLRKANQTLDDQNQ